MVVRSGHFANFLVWVSSAAEDGLVKTSCLPKGGGDRGNRARVVEIHVNELRTHRDRKLTQDVLAKEAKRSWSKKLQNFLHKLGRRAVTKASSR